MQRFVAERPADLQPPRLPPIRWVSPLVSDDYAEYRDAAFPDRVGCAAPAQALVEFRPVLGPQWDGLGITDRGPVLVEAKAHLGEFLSPASKAGGASRDRIAAAFAQVQADLGIRPGSDWSRVFFQYANRLAHLWFLRRQGVGADLVFVGFLGDAEMAGPERQDVWQAAFAAADHALGLPRVHALSRHVHHVYPDTRLLTRAGW